MKKAIIFVVVFVCLFSVITVYVSNIKRVKMDFVEDVDVCFVYGSTDVLCRLGDEEIETIKAIFNGKKTYKDNLSCGFNEDVSLVINNKQTFCIARDACPIIYWKEENRYFKLTEPEKMQMYALLEPYGFFFPCL